MKWLAGVMMLMQLAAAASAVSFFSVLLDEWQLFKLQYGKTYKNFTEENLRMKIFLENKKTILAHNQQFVIGKESYSLQMNRFGDMLHSEFLSVMNGLHWNGTDRSQGLWGTRFIGPDDDVTLPETVNWVQKGAVTPIKNQGQCGSCWAFSTTGSLEGQHFRKTGQLVSLSEQNLIDCSESDGNHGCAGGLMDFAFKYVKENGGIDTEEAYPYEAKDDTCRYNSRYSGADSVGFVEIPKGDEKALQKALATVGPISVSINASDRGFMFYKSGIYESSECSSTYLDHGVLAVGYGTENGIDYWLVKNSWDTVWGDQGYIKMRRNHNNMCGIASLASYPLV